MFRAFREICGYALMAFVKRVRLRRANEMLKGPAAETSVAGLAFARGFANLGHFAREYREAFNEGPLETPVRSRR